MLAVDARRVAIVGAGRVGHSTAQQFAAAGYVVSIQDRTTNTWSERCGVFETISGNWSPLTNWAVTD